MLPSLPLPRCSGGGCDDLVPAMVPDRVKASCRLVILSFFNKPTPGEGLRGDVTVKGCACAEMGGGK